VAAPESVHPAFLHDSASPSAGFAHLFRSHSAASILAVSLDFLTVFLASAIAARFRPLAPAVPGAARTLPSFHSSTAFFAAHLVWFGLCLIFFMRSYGLYRPPQQMSGLHELRMGIHAVVIAGLTLCGTLYLTGGAFISRLEVLLTILFTFLLLTARRTAQRHMLYQRYRAGIETRNILIVGNGRVAHALRNHLLSLHHHGFRFKGFILTPADAQCDQTDDPNPHDIAGTLDNLLTRARELFVDEIFLSVPTDSAFVLRLVQDARCFGIDVRAVPDLYDGLAWNAPVEYFGQFPTLPLHRRDLPLGSALAKRLLDLSLAAACLLLLAPLLALIATIIKLDSPGPIFYVAKRIGRKGRTFDCYKFRSMVPNADQLRADLADRNERDGILFKIAHDPRVTRIGRLLRKYSLDELPQLLNILRGDMSLVGPRPPMADEVSRYELPHLRRLDVLPGLTGLWQVEARQDPSFDSYISLDTAYVENWSLLLDLKILLRTVAVVVAGTGSTREIRHRNFPRSSRNPSAVVRGKLIK
jgi:exopolysaccharide biosynthesis polyprenyl glycosylphosphotransferase